MLERSIFTTTEVQERTIEKVIALIVGLLSLIVGGYMIISIHSTDSILLGSGIVFTGISLIFIFR